jgi:hypothetical protein
VIKGGGTPEENAIELAKRLGTYNAIDRSKQYEGRRYTTEALLNNDNLAFAKIRKLEREKFHHRLWLIAASAASAVLTRAPEIYSFLVKLTR